MGILGINCAYGFSDRLLLSILGINHQLYYYPEIMEQTDIYAEDIFTKVRIVTKKNYIDFPYYA